MRPNALNKEERGVLLLLGASSLLFISETHQPYILQGGLGVVTSPSYHSTSPAHSTPTSQDVTHTLYTNKSGCKVTACPVSIQKPTIQSKTRDECDVPEFNTKISSLLSTFGPLDYPDVTLVFHINVSLLYMLFQIIA